MKTGFSYRLRRVEEGLNQKTSDVATWGVESARPLIQLLNEVCSYGKSTPRYTEVEMEQLAYDWGMEIEKKYPSFEAYHQRPATELSGHLKNLLDQVYGKTGKEI